MKHLYFFQKKLPECLLWLAPLALLAYTSLRAYHLSLTHDECGSFAIWTNYPIFKCHSSPDCWGSANLHFLYVLLMKPCIRLFGDSELAIRLPALFGHFIYLVFSGKLARSLTQYSWLALGGFLLLNVNPYLLEFHGLARGYGLAVSFMMMSLFFFYRHLQSGKLSAVAGMFGGAVLAALSNFTLLNFFACLLAVFGGLALADIFFQKEAAKKRAAWQGLGLAAAFSVLLAWMVYPPIRTLRAVGEFEWGTGSFYDTMESLVRVSLYGERYWHMYNVEFFGVLFLALMTTALVSSIRSFLKNPQGVWERFFLAGCALPLLASVAAIAQHHLLDSQYQVNRTALMFIPLCALTVFLLFVHWQSANSTNSIFRWRVALPAAIVIFCLIHLGRAAQLSYTSEWGYDAQTKEMLNYLHARLPPGKKIKLGLDWLFHPSSSYYFKTTPYDFSETLIYEKELRRDTFYDYYYVQPEDIPQLHPAYKLEKQFTWVGSLMKK